MILTDTKYTIPTDLDNFHDKLIEQRSEVTKLACNQKGQAYAITRTYTINNIGVDVIIKMKEIQPNISQDLPLPFQKTGKSSAKITFKTYDSKVFSVLKYFFIQVNQFSYGREIFYFDNVITKKTNEKKYLIKEQQLVNEKI